jgi:hypothetical protein
MSRIKELKVRSFRADGTEIFINPETGMYDPPVSPPIEMQKRVLYIINNRREEEARKNGFRIKYCSLLVTKRYIAKTVALISWHQFVNRLKYGIQN